MTSRPGPDFLCIGMQKAGTGWLYDQLQFHPDFWMPPIKEFHYFDRVFPDNDLTELISLARADPLRTSRKRMRRNWRPLDDRDFAFFSSAEACEGEEIELPRYAELFRPKAALLSGDVTPAYSTLDESVVKNILSYLPATRVVLLLRDPIERVWSQICMSWRRGKFPVEILEEPARFRLYLNTPQVRDRSFPTEIFHRWSRHVPSGQMRTFFLDHITSQPDRVRHDLLEFLGADPAKPSGEFNPSFNRKSVQEKLEMTDATKQLLIEHFAAEIPACGDLFGGPALTWKEQYGL